MQNVLEVKELTKKYGDQYALKDVSLSIKKGEVYGLIGKNGAGKTTLIKIITQVIYPSGGTVSGLSEPTRMDQSPQPYWICHRDPCSSCPHVGL